MISKFTYLKKMLRYFLIFGFLFVAVNAEGRFAVLETSSSIKFQGELPIPGVDVGDVILAATGNTISDDVQWSGLSIEDPFNLPRKAMVALIDGASIDIKPAKFEAPLESAGVDDSLEMLIAEMRASKTSTCDIDYSKKQASKTAHKCFGIVMHTKESKPSLPTTKALNREDVVAGHFLTAIADLNDAVDNYLKLKDSKDIELRSLVVVRISLAPIAQAYGTDSAQHAEAVELVQNVIRKLRKAAGDAIFIALSTTSDAKSRSKRETVAPSDKNELNLAKYYDANYPVIFNIILWFMVVFFLSLLAISYAIGSMDPGKDSIIYRMTSTRMKKDN